MSKIEDVWARMERSAMAFAAEQERIDQVRGMGSVPDECGPEIPVAPARGPVRMFDPVALYPKGDDDFEMKPAGYQGRKALKRGDVFDVMAATAARAKKDAPFTASQVNIGRVYGGLVQKLESEGVKLSSLEGRVSGGGNGGRDFMDARLARLDRVARMRARIGDGSALVVRRNRPSQRGSRASILDRDLVYGVCVKDQSLAGVLKAHGWAYKSSLVEDLRVALAAALDRMNGPRRRSGIQTIHMF